ncbi:MAG: anhydro-N-acetylmuramic acid kinase, partial [Caldithrix sp.]|nr:anhydro-N-acetylmuramic acid kinase [Caldithrix sp.]
GQQTQIQFIAGNSYAYEARQKRNLLNLLHSDTISLQMISQLNFYLPMIWADMIGAFLTENNIHKEDIDWIGSHGHTLWHQPDNAWFMHREVRSTLQMGDPSVLAQLTRIPVVGDFRVADVALGGQGAPLIPYFDWVFFSSFKTDMLILNIGGISNITFVPGDGDFNKLMAFDCGPGNMLIDQVMEHLYQQPYDAGGQKAASGQFSLELFQFLNSIDHFPHQSPPKSTGREHYGKKFVDRILQRAAQLNMTKEDIVHTVSEYTALSIAENYKKFIEPQHAADVLVAGGGGASNTFLLHRLQHHLQTLTLAKATDYDLNEDYKEAIGFAVLANETIHGNPGNVPFASGAARPAILGKICPV